VGSMSATTLKGSPICTWGEHVIADDEYYYTINPEGGYGSPEALCCEKCIRKPENEYIRQRMIDAGAKELEQ
jgi:hypothetical protein